MLQHQQHIGSERRVHQRFEDLRASLVQLGGNNNGIVLNISEGGMAILFAEELDVSTLRNLRFQAPEFEHWMDISAEIAWISDSRKQAGLRFKGLSETARTQLRAGISIATTRTKWAEYAKQADASTERREEVTDSMPASFAATAAGSATPVASEPEHVSNQANANSLAEEIVENEGLLPSDVREAALDSRLPETHPEIETKEKVTSSPESKEESKQHAPPQPLNSVDTKPQKTSAAVALDARSSPLALQKSSVAQMPSRSVFPTSPRKQPTLAPQGTSGPTNISFVKWAVVATIAILASALAFLVGWILGDPSRIKLGH